MGNRAVLCFNEFKPKNLAIYLHWNGGRDSIEGFLKATRILMAERLGDSSYGSARLIQVIGTYISGNLSFGIGTCEEFGSDQDNGVYIIDSEKMTIKDRIFPNWYVENGTKFKEQTTYNTNEFANDVIALINASYAGEGNKIIREDPLPSAEEYDAAQEAAGTKKNSLN